VRCLASRRSFSRPAQLGGGCTCCCACSPSPDCSPLYHLVGPTLCARCARVRLPEDCLVVCVWVRGFVFCGRRTGNSELCMVLVPPPPRSPDAAPATPADSACAPSPEATAATQLRHPGVLALLCGTCAVVVDLVALSARATALLARRLPVPIPSEAVEVSDGARLPRPFARTQAYAPIVHGVEHAARSVQLTNTVLLSRVGGACGLVLVWLCCPRGRPDTEPWSRCRPCCLTGATPRLCGGRRCVLCMPAVLAMLAMLAVLAVCARLFGMLAVCVCCECCA
jgi:hypothetical protein